MCSTTFTASMVLSCDRLFFFFFSSRRRHTRFDCDWSSDVCSSDLAHDLAQFGRSAMAELRQVMGLLAPAADQTDLAPQPGIDQLPALVDRVRTTGTPVRLTVRGAVRPVPAGIDLAAYRVVQEALTNTVKHAAGAAATVLLEYGADG